VAALFLFGLKRPVWAVAALLDSQLTLTSYMIETPFGVAISLRLLLIVLAVLVVWRMIGRENADVGPGSRRIIKPVIALLVLSTAANLANSDLTFVLTDFRNLFAGLLIVILIPVVVRSGRSLKILASVALVGVTASSLVGVMQALGAPAAGGTTLVPGFLSNGEGTGGVPGMAETQLELSFVLPVALLTTLAVYVAGGATRGIDRILLLAIPAMGAALYFTQTRSALLAALAGLIALALFLRTRIRAEILLFIVIVVIGFIEMFGFRAGIYLGGRSASSQEESGQSRPILWQAGVAAAVDNPILGIGGDQFTTVSPRYADAVDSDLLRYEEDRYWSYRTLGNDGPHNDFLNLWVSYGTPALFVYVWLYVAMLHNFFEAYRGSRGKFIRAMSVGMAAALIAYAANAFYHNVMTTMPLFWILAGFSLALTKLVSQQKRLPQEARRPTP
jgi:O-antigen ligase